MLTHDSEVRPLDAAVSVDGDQGLFRVTLESGGGGRNSEYRKALDVILKNAVEHGGYAVAKVPLASRKAIALEPRFPHFANSFQRHLVVGVVDAGRDVEQAENLVL